MKIWFQKHVVQGRMPGLDRALEGHLRRLLEPGTEVVFHSLPPDVDSLRKVTHFLAEK